MFECHDGSGAALFQPRLTAAWLDQRPVQLLLRSDAHQICTKQGHTVWPPSPVTKEVPAREEMLTVTLQDFSTASPPPWTARHPSCPLALSPSRPLAFLLPAHNGMPTQAGRWVRCFGTGFEQFASLLATATVGAVGTPAGTSAASALGGPIDRTQVSRRRHCHFTDVPLSIAIDTPTKMERGVQQNDSLADG